MVVVILGVLLRDRFNLIGNVVTHVLRVVSGRPPCHRGILKVGQVRGDTSMTPGKPLYCIVIIGDFPRSSV